MISKKLIILLLVLVIIIIGLFLQALFECKNISSVNMQEDTQENILADISHPECLDLLVQKIGELITIVGALLMGMALNEVISRRNTN